MEEILASISRIIADDKRPAETSAPPAGEPKNAVLELTEAVAEDGTVRRIAPRATAVTERVEPAAERIEPAPPRLTTAAPAPPAGGPKLASGVRDHVVSAAAAGAAAAALGRLAATPPAGSPREEAGRGEGAQTLEDIVRDALRPLLRAWLDAHLPALAEKLAREEIARVVEQAGLR